MRGQKQIRNTVVICAMFAVVAAMCLPASAAVEVTEVLAGGYLDYDDPISGKMHNGDWFEITNTGDSAVTLSGWKWRDDNDGHDLITIPDVTLAAGESVILLGEDEDGYTTDWQTVWGVTGQLITQGDMGEFHGLGKSGDSVFLYDNNDVLVDTATWGDIGDGFSWDFVNNHLSVSGTDGAWTATDPVGSDVASPYSTVPEPATMFLLTIGSGLLALRHRNRKIN